MSYLDPFLDQHLRNVPAAQVSFDSVYASDAVNVKTSNCTAGPNSIMGENGMLISVYPNPTDGLIYIKSDKQVTEVSVIDAFGREVIRSNGNSRADISALASGIYFVKIEVQQGTGAIFKIIKK